MLINLICSNQLKKFLTESLESRGLSISNNAKLTLVENGFELPAQGITVVFDYQSLNDLLDILNLMSRKQDYPKNIIVGKHRDAEKYEIIPYKDIMYFEAEGNFTYCFTPGNRYRVKNKLYELEKSLCEQGFVRVNKSILVNIIHVLEIIPWFGSRLLLKLTNKAELEVSRNYVKSFKEFLEL